MAKQARAGETGKQATKHARSGETGKQANAAIMDNATGRRDAQAPPGLHCTEVKAPGKGDTDSTGVPEEGEGGSGDVPRYVPTPEELRLREVSGDWVHGNPGTHLNGGVTNNLAWQAWWHELAVMPSRHYDAPSGKVGRRFVGMLGAEIQGVRDRRWNSERFIVFQTVILQQARHVTASHTIMRRIEKRLDAWGSGKHAMLVGDTLRSCEDYLTAARREETAKHRAQTYHSLVLRGKLRSAIIWITERETGGFLQRFNICILKWNIVECVNSKFLHHTYRRPELMGNLTTAIFLFKL